MPKNKPKNMSTKADKKKKGKKKKIGFNPRGLLKKAFMRNTAFKKLMDALDN